MNTDRTRPPLSRLVRKMPADLSALLAVVVLANLAVVVPIVNESLVRVVIGLVFVLFVPGYALVAVLFPEARGPPTVDSSDLASAIRGHRDAREGEGTETGSPDERLFERFRPIDGFERAALSFGLSLAIVPLLMLGLSFSPFEFAPVPILATISAFTVICTAVAVKRRWALAEDHRFRVPYREWLAAGRRSIADAESQNAVLSVALALAVVLAVGTFTFAIVAPQDGEQFTEFYVLTEADDGELVAADYPETVSPGEPEPLHVGIENYEQETTEYTVVVQLQRVEGDRESAVTDRTEVDRFTTTLDHDETWISERYLDVSDELTGEDLRLTFLLYEGPAPDAPTRDNAYRKLHIWVDVDEGTQAY